MWKTVKLGDVCEIQPKKAQAKKKLVDTDTISFMPMKDLGINEMHPTANQKKTLAKAYSSYTYFEDNDVLLAKITPCFENGKLGIASNLMNGVGFGSSEYIVLRCGEEVLPQYIYYHLNQPSFRAEGKAQMSGAVGHKRVPIDFVENLEIPLPPLAEQERIVAKLDAAFAEIDRGIKTTQAKESEISRLNTSILSTTLTEHNHKIVKLGSIATVIAGQSPKGEYYNKEGRGTPFYQGKKDYGKRYLNEPKVWTDKVTKLAEKDDILLSVRAPIGALNIATQQICIGRGLAAIRPSTKILNDYLFYSLLLISNKLEGSSGAIFNSINKSQIEALEVTLPSIEEQQNIVDKLDAALEKIKLTEYSNEAVIKNFIKLKSAILIKELQSKEAA